MSDFQSTYPVQRSAVDRPSVTRAPRAVKTDEQLLAEAEKRIGLLRSKVLAHRDKQRLELVDDLYVKHGVEAVANDVSERQRLTSLREKLFLTG